MAEGVTIKCQDVWRELSGYLENELTARQRAVLEEHFRACKHCSAILDGTRNVIRLACDGRSFEIPSGFSRRLEQRLRGADRKR